MFLLLLLISFVICFDVDKIILMETWDVFKPSKNCYIHAEKLSNWQVACVEVEYKAASYAILDNSDFYMYFLILPKKFKLKFVIEVLRGEGLKSFKDFQNTKSMKCSFVDDNNVFHDKYHIDDEAVKCVQSVKYSNIRDIDNSLIEFYTLTKDTRIWNKVSLISIAHAIRVKYGKYLDKLSDGLIKNGLSLDADVIIK